MQCLIALQVITGYNAKASTSNCTWLNEQNELMMSVNRQALKHIRQSAKNSQTRAGGKALHIQIGNLVLLRDHPEGWNKIQDNYKSQLFVIVAHHKDPNVSVIQSIIKKGQKWKTVIEQQWFELKKPQEDPTMADPIIKGPKYESKLQKMEKPQVCHP